MIAVRDSNAGSAQPYPRCDLRREEGRNQSQQVLEYELRHGECVALGMLAENELACGRGILARADADRIAVLLGRLGLPVRLPQPVDPAEVVRICRLDKKTVGGALHFVLLRGIGTSERVADVTADEITAALRVIQ